MPIPDDKLLELYKRLEREYTEKTKKSRELYEKARNYMPAGVSYSIRFFNPYPLYIAKGKGTRVWDVDGNEYIDFWMGHGVHLLGHLPEVVEDTLKRVLDIGTHLGFEHPYLVEYAEFLSKTIPGLQQVRFTNSGSEANNYAIRIARAYTKRKYIVKMEGGWHGSVNSLHVSVRRLETHLPESAGILKEHVEYTLSIPFNDIDALEKTLKKYEVAAVILEPVMGAAGCIEPDPGYLREVRRLTLEHGSLLIFDEVITGLRLAPGGAQEYFGVKADIVVLGKAIGGGVGSIGAFGGSVEIMELLDHTKKTPDELVFHGGTFVGNPVVILAGYTLARYLSEHRELYERANELWSFFRRRAQEICIEYSIDCWTTGIASLTGLHFTTRKPRSAREVETLRWSRVIERMFNLYSRVHGILYVSETRAHFLPSLVHSREEIQRLLDTLIGFFEELKNV